MIKQSKERTMSVDLYDYINELLDRGECEAALERLEHLEYEAWLLKGLCYEEMGDIEKAISCYQEGIKADPADSMCWSCMGTCHKEMGNFIYARHCYEQSLLIVPNLVVPRINLAGLLDDEFHEYDNALSCIQVAEKLEPENGLVYLTKANILKDMCNYEDAVKTYEKALEFGPSHTGFNQNCDDTEKGWASSDAEWYVSLYNNLGLCYKRLGRYTEAIETFRQGLEFEEDGGIYNNMGLVYHYIGEQENAFNCFYKAKQLGISTALKNLLLFYPWIDPSEYDQ